MSGRAVVLLSGGIDSATVLAIAQADGFTPYALSFSYGQRHAVELHAATLVAKAQGAAQHLIASAHASLFAGSALTDRDIPVPGNPAERIDATYVPARNTVFLSMALAWAESIGAADIFIGVNADDYAGYPDCRPEYLSAFQRMAALATNAGPVGDTRPADRPHQDGDHQTRPGTGRGLLAHAQLLQPGATAMRGLRRVHPPRCRVR